MSSKTRIVVLHMKEIIYTAIFAVLAIVLILLLIFMFLPKVRGSHNKTAKYNPGVYTSDLTVGDTTLSLEVTVSETEITSIHFSNLNETVSAMYPLLQPAIEEIADQIVANQSLDDIQYTEETHYTKTAELDRILSQGLYAGNPGRAMEQDAAEPDGTPVLFGYFCDLPRIVRFNTALELMERPGTLICFDFQADVLRRYCSDRVHLQTIDFTKFEGRLFP